MQRLDLIDIGTKRYTAHVAGYSFDRIGRKTMVVENVASIDGTVKFDHCWFVYCSVWQGINNGDLIEFSARPMKYIKGYHGQQHKEYTLDTPHNIRVKGHCKRERREWHD
jgi:hypothetical protein